MKKLTYTVIIAALAWAGFWFWSANAYKSGIAAWFDARQNAGWIAEYDDIQVRGFPNRLDTTLAAPRLGNPENGILWETAFLQILRLSYDPSHLIFVWDDAQQLALADSNVAISSTDMRASLELQSVTDWEMQRAIWVAENLVVKSTHDLDVSADVAQVSLEAKPDAEATYRFAIDARGLTGAVPGWLDGNDRAKIDRLTFDAEIDLNAKLDQVTLLQTRPLPQQIRLSLAEATWDDISIAAAGTLDITAAGTPIGTLTLQLRNWRQTIAKERQSDRLSPRALDQIEFTLGLIAGLSGNPETLDLPFDFRNGQIWLGPINLGPAPQLILP